MPPRWREKLERNTSDEEEAETEEQQNIWSSYLKNVGVNLLIYCVLCMAIIALMFYFGKPLIAGLLTAPWGNIVTALITIIICAPFLWALMRKDSQNDDAVALWNSSRAARVKLVAFQLLRLVVAAAFVSYILYRTVQWGGMLGIFIVLAIVFSILFSPSLRKQSEKMSKTFSENLTEREKGGMA